MNHVDVVSVRRVRESDFDQLVRLISETIEISYAEVYPPRAVQFFKDFHSERKIADRSRIGTTLVVEEDGKLVATGNEARASGVTEIGLSISLPSKSFYASLGYRVVEEISRDVGEGQRLDFWKAVKQLPTS